MESRHPNSHDVATDTLAPVLRGEGRVRGGPACDYPTKPAIERSLALIPLIRPTATFSPEYRGEGSQASLKFALLRPGDPKSANLSDFKTPPPRGRFRSETLVQRAVHLCLRKTRPIQHECFRFCQNRQDKCLADPLNALACARAGRLLSRRDQAASDCREPQASE